MARFTQSIGLSKEASEFLKTHNAKTIGSWKMTTGIGYEDVMGSIYEAEIEEDYMGIAQNATYAEVTDTTPWSSGSMIHTALRDLATGEVCFKWKEEDIHWD